MFTEHESTQNMQIDTTWWLDYVLDMDKFGYFPHSYTGIAVQDLKTLAYFRYPTIAFKIIRKISGSIKSSSEEESLLFTGPVTVVMSKSSDRRWAYNVEFILRFLYCVQEGSSWDYSLGKLRARLKLECMPDQNIAIEGWITQERYESKAYVWRIVRLGFTFLTAKNILLDAWLLSDGRQNPNNDPLFFKALVRVIEG